MGTNTPYLDLFKFDGTDVVDLQADFNDNSDKVDTWAQAHRGFNDGQVLDWYTQATAVPDGSNLGVLTLSASLYDAVAADVLDLAPGDLLNSGTDAGDDYILQANATDTLWFKKAGLYLVTATVGQIDGVVAAVDFTSSIHSAHTVVRADHPAMSFMFAVGAIDIAAPGLTAGGTLNASVYNGSGAPQDVTVEMYVMRVL